MLLEWKHPLERENCLLFPLHLSGPFGIPRFDGDRFKDAKDK